MRNLLLFLYDSKSISDEEFLTLYESYSSKNPEFPYSSYPKFDFDQMDESECLAEFRVRKQDITLLANVLQLPVTIRCPQRTTCDRTEGLCMLLKRFSYPCRYSDMIHRFARPVPEISMITNTVMDHIFVSHGHRISQWNFDILSPPMLQEYADVIHAKGAPLNNCFGFIDGTVRPISRPGQHQRIVYNGHKRVHSLKFQSVALPNGLIGNMYGPVGKLCSLGCHENKLPHKVSLIYLFYLFVLVCRGEKTRCKHVGRFQSSAGIGKECIFPNRPAHECLW